MLLNDDGQFKLAASGKAMPWMLEQDRMKMNRRVRGGPRLKYLNSEVHDSQRHLMFVGALIQGWPNSDINTANKVVRFVVFVMTTLRWGRFAMTVCHNRIAAGASVPTPAVAFNCR
jgi:hypothetical protein